MSCLPELIWAAWVDGELGPEETRRAEAHLVHCERCRVRVLALREEGLLLDASLRGEPAPAAAPSEAAPPPRRPGLRMAATAVGIGGLGLLGGLLEQRLAGGAGLLGAFDPGALLSGALEFFFLLQRRAPGFFALALAVAATASVSALATFAVTALLRRMDPKLALLLVAQLPLLVSAPADAYQLRRGEEVRIAAGERLEGALIAGAERVVIEGVLLGDLVAGAERVEVRGRIEGNVYAWADVVEIEGHVTGDVYLGARHARIAGEVAGTAHVVGERAELARSGRVGRDLWLLADRIELRGHVTRDASALCEAFRMDGRVERDVLVRTGRATLGAEARVGGDLAVRLPPGRDAEIDPRAHVGGEQRLTHGPLRPGRAFAHLAERGFWLWLVVRLAAAFATGLALWWLWPGLFEPGFGSAAGVARAAGIGLLALLATPLLLALLAVTLIGLPLAAAGLFALLAALYAAGILAAARVGAALLHPPARNLRAFGLSLLVGLLVLGAASSLPFFGGIVRVLSALAGLGLVVEAARRARGRPLLDRA